MKMNMNVRVIVNPFYENAGQGDVDYLEVLNKYLNVGEVQGHGECVSEIFGVEGLDNQHSDSWRMD